MEPGRFGSRTAFFGAPVSKDARRHLGMDETVTLMDDFFTLAGELLASQRNACLIDRLTTVHGYCQLLELYPQDHEYRRKFQRAMGDLRLLLAEANEAAMRCKPLIRPA
jgi:hypothetical protein